MTASTATAKSPAQSRRSGAHDHERDRQRGARSPRKPACLVFAQACFAAAAGALIRSRRDAQCAESMALRARFRPVTGEVCQTRARDDEQVRRSSLLASTVCRRRACRASRGPGFAPRNNPCTSPELGDVRSKGRKGEARPATAFGPGERGRPIAAPPGGSGDDSQRRRPPRQTLGPPAAAPPSSRVQDRADRSPEALTRAKLIDNDEVLDAQDLAHEILS